MLRLSRHPSSSCTPRPFTSCSLLHRQSLMRPGHVTTHSSSNQATPRRAREATSQRNAKIIWRSHHRHRHRNHKRCHGLLACFLQGISQRRSHGFVSETRHVEIVGFADVLNSPTANSGKALGAQRGNGDADELELGAWGGRRRCPVSGDPVFVIRQSSSLADSSSSLYGPYAP